MIGTEEMIIEITKKLFAEMEETETDTDILGKIIGFLLMAYQSAQNPQDVKAIA